MSNEKRYCVHVQHAPNKYDETSDMHLIKERVVGEDGVERPNIRLVRDYKRPFKVTNKETRAQHQQKREWEWEQVCETHESTQAGLGHAVARAMDFRGGYPNLKKLLNSPYVYGCDVSAATILKKTEDAKNDAMQETPYRPNLNMGILDYETDVVNRTEKIISGSFVFNRIAYLVCTEDFAKRCGSDPEGQVRARVNYHLRDLIENQGYEVKFKILKDDLACVRALMGLAHQLRPDLVAIWNMAFDMGKMLACLEQHRVDPADIFCDPSVPDEFRTFNYIEDQLVKRTSSGKVMPKHPADLWHKVDCLASFFIIDAMCVYKMLRAMKGMKPSYSLDAILNEEIKIGKLRLDEAEGYTGLAWHRVMQTNYVADYLVYNAFDCISMQLLDDKTGDIQRALASYAGISEFRNLRSNPKRLTDSIHFYLQEQGKVLCSTGKDMLVPDDDLLLNGRDWIVTLAYELAHDYGLKIDEAELLATRIATHVFDIDITSGYPTTQLVCNISKSTTLAEICGIEDMPEVEQRRIGVNMTACNTNAVDIAQSALGMESLGALYDEFMAECA